MLTVAARVFAAELAAPPVAVLAVEAAVPVLASCSASDRAITGRGSLACAAHLAASVRLAGERA